MRPRGALRERDFRLILVVWGLSALGDFIAVVALTLRVQEETESGLAVAGLLIAAALPIALLNPVAGWLVDHRPTRTLLSAAAAFQGLVAVALAQVDSTAATLALVCALNCGLAVERPALFALLPRIVGEERAPSAYAWFESVKYAAIALGMALGGVLAGAVGPSTAVLVDAATFALTAVAALTLRAGREPPAAGARTAPAEPHAFTAGLRLIAADRLLGTTMVVVVVGLLFAGLDNIVGVFFAKDSLGTTDAGYGALASSWGLGMIAGAALAGRRARGPAAATHVIVAVAAMGVAIGLTAASPVLAVAIACFLAGGAANGYENVAMRVLLAARVPDELRGRVFAAYQGVLTPADFAALAAGGALVQLLGPRATLAAAGAGTLIIVLLALPAFRRADRRPRVYSG